tara:strand:+ start:2433 stop:2615 length:183 start_codon:yes stop_codon:yes gene_type:complete
MDTIQPIKISIHELQLINKLKKEYNEIKEKISNEIYQEIIEELTKSTTKLENKTLKTKIT